ncbi:CDP-diacylglycerol--glycerol-3-phosphate 3-phosphatidyltransferase [Demequina mangrovi]|uniref:CDP-diacylglycerol--glycerol-3-phosphate 3-phosphatidyltransferase n=1 Tax=Demequina mangrovi TaxID=1043493 RepID=A0A1H6Z2V0_9MICO|nr:CDP-diacylglycerol--glycerol-3-phosphate 3-phosphatidyltransferase [Demequina mangrovi]SEJ47731.1 CDP-diacylglycerol--glycerol-3-phosphate 3-phosphatidyltransferase [Demequina mangrovi]
MTSAVPNVLTVARLVMVPVVLALLFIDDGAEGAARWWALALFMIAAATDFFDGYLARRWGVVSPFGKLADPIADKALVLGVLGMLVLTDGIPWWPVVIIAARELWVTIGRLLVAAGTVIPASPGGKAKTMAQLLAIWLYLIPGMPGWVDQAAWWVLLVATALALVTGIDYTVKILQAAREQRADGHAAA